MSRDQRKYREHDRHQKHAQRAARLRGETDAREGRPAAPPPGLEKDYMRGYEGGGR